MPLEPNQLSDVIEETAMGAAEFETDDHRAKAHNLKDLIAADKHLAAKAAAKGKKLGGIRVGRFIPPGAAPR